MVESWQQEEKNSITWKKTTTAFLIDLVERKTSESIRRQ